MAERYNVWSKCLDPPVTRWHKLHDSITRDTAEHTVVEGRHRSAKYGTRMLYESRPGSTPPPGPSTELLPVMAKRVPS